MKCGRCGIETGMHTMSFFDTTEICMRCDDLEKRHPSWEYAHRIEVEHVKAGDLNFKGVGLPADFESDWLRPQAATPREPRRNLIV